MRVKIDRCPECGQDLTDRTICLCGLIWEDRGNGTLEPRELKSHPNGEFVLNDDWKVTVKRKEGTNRDYRGIEDLHGNVWFK